MPLQQQVVAVTVLGRDYQFKASIEQQQHLQQAAKQLDARLTALHNQSPLTNRDQLLVYIALNSLMEMTVLQQQYDVDQQRLTGLLQELTAHQ